MIEECLRTARAVHRILVALTAATLLSFLADSEIDELQDAQATLTSLDKLQYSDFLKFRDAAFLEHEYSENARARLKLLNQRLSITVPKETHKELLNSLPRSTPPVTSLSTLTDYRALLRNWNDRTMTVLAPSVNELAELIENANNRAENSRICGIWVSEGDFHSDTHQIQELGFTVQHSTAENCSVPLMVEQGVVGTFKDLSIPGTSLSSWARDRYAGTRLSKEVQNADRHTLATLNPVWDRVSDFDIAEASAYVQREIANAKAAQFSRISVLGLKFPLSVVSWAVPLAILILYFYSNAYISIAHNQLQLYPQSPGEFPWIPIVASPLYSAFGLATVVLPVITIDGLVLVRATTFGLDGLWLSWLLTGTGTFLALWHARQIWRLRVAMMGYSGSE